MSLAEGKKVWGPHAVECLTLVMLKPVLGENFSSWELLRWQYPQLLELIVPRGKNRHHPNIRWDNKNFITSLV